MMYPLLLSIAIGALALWLSFRYRGGPRSRPPGPQGEFLIGNARQLQPFHAWLYYTKLAHQYGDVVHLDVIGQPIICLSSLQAAEDLLVKKSTIFSDRHNPVMAAELVGFGQAMVFSSGLRWQVSRKLAHQWLGPLTVARSHAYIENEVHAFMRRFLSTSQLVIQEFQFAVGRMMLDTTYGIVPEGRDNIHLQYSDEAAIIFGLCTQPGKFLVDTFPLLKYVPSWVPFAGFQKVASRWGERIWSAVNLPFIEAQKEMEHGAARSSYVSQALLDPPAGATEDIIRWTAGTLYGASIDTMTSAFSTFLLNMVLHSDIQEKGRAEIQRVIGSHRLPTLADRKDLPYVEAILKETLRWHPPAPLSVPYKATEDCKYREWTILKGTIILANVWAISRDQENYPSPEEFNPERFMSSASVLDPHRYFFGFGRRICPGQHFADSVLWITMATLLASTKMTKCVDDDGREVTPSTEYTGGMVCKPLPFPYQVEPLPGITSASFATAV